MKMTPKETQLQPHELALQLSPMDADTFMSLVEDMKIGKVLEPIVLYEGKILDGWHRYRAARAAAKPFKTVEFDGDDPVLFVWQKNGLRRHWSQTDKALNYAKLMAFGKTWKGNGKPHLQGEVTNEDLEKYAESIGLDLPDLRAEMRLLTNGLTPDIRRAVVDLLLEAPDRSAETPEVTK